ncbi:energy transducer TonB [Prochlorococcus marinus]|uniref:energy transducer TonB n=1 Tax=Prochlorococcus marinus TaxID=1219 RepID=UPI0039B059F5
MKKIRTNRINYYILLSVLIHLSLFLFVEKEKDISFGKKIIPIELIDNFKEPGFGEATKRSKKLIKRPSIKEELKNEINNKNPLDQEKSFEDNKNNKKINEKKFEQKKDKSNSINQPMLKEEKRSGSREGIKNNEPEKGSLTGEGKIKITCLKCVRPIYPPIALRRGAEGAPKVKVWINKKGKVIKAELISISGNESIDRAAKKAAINSTFYPLEEETSINIEYDLKIR